MTLILVADLPIMESVTQVHHASNLNSKKTDFEASVDLLPTLQLHILFFVCVAGKQPK